MATAIVSPKAALERPAETPRKIAANAGDPRSGYALPAVSCIRKPWPTITPALTPITIDFNTVQGCSQGKLADIAKRQMDDVSLTNGADALTICDNQSLQAIRSELPRALANRIPGCLVWRGKVSGGIMLVRKSDAVCSLPDGKGYICDAVNARHPLGNNAIGDSMEAVAPCPGELLRRFGLQS